VAGPHAAAPADLRRSAAVPAEPLIHWPEPITNFLTYLAVFASAGAIGFRYAVLRSPQTLDVAGDAAQIHARAARGAAAIGLAGAIVGAVLFAATFPELAARLHGSIGYLLVRSRPTALGTLMAVLAIVGLLLALLGRPVGWPLAAVGVILGELRAVASGRPTQLINPLHILSGALWLGTLFVLVAAGLPAALSASDRARRGPIVATMVNRFSPLALTAGGTLVLFGVITAWRHLKRLDALWTTPYGFTLFGKLCVVAVVFALGAWNWRRQRPLLGTEPAAQTIRRSARAELSFALVVLIITSFLVALPAPRG
jgi:putative copper export protein